MSHNHEPINIFAYQSLIIITTSTVECGVVELHCWADITDISLYIQLIAHNTLKESLKDKMASYMRMRLG